MWFDARVNGAHAKEQAEWVADGSYLQLRVYNSDGADLGEAIWKVTKRFKLESTGCFASGSYKGSNSTQYHRWVTRPASKGGAPDPLLLHLCASGAAKCDEEHKKEFSQHVDFWKALDADDASKQVRKWTGKAMLVTSSEEEDDDDEQEEEEEEESEKDVAMKAAKKKKKKSGAMKKKDPLDDVIDDVDDDDDEQEEEEESDDSAPPPMKSMKVKGKRKVKKVTVPEPVDAASSGSALAAALARKAAAVVAPKDKKKRKKKKKKAQKEPASKALARFLDLDSDSDEDAHGLGKVSRRRKRTHYWKIHQRDPGQLSNLAINSFLGDLGRADPSAVDIDDRACVMRFLLAHVVPVYTPSVLGEERWRLLRGVASLSDHILRGHLAEALDVCLHIFKAELKAQKDGHWHSARHLILLPADTLGSATTQDEDEVLDEIATREAKIFKMKRDAGRPE